MAALVTPYEPLSERVKQLVSSHSESWPPLHSSQTQEVIAQLIERVDALEQALHAIALEVEKPAAGSGRREADTSGI